MCRCPFEGDPQNPEIMQCECCTHQQEYTGWKKEFCNPCIFTQFPNRYSALFHLYNKTLDIRTLGGGMASVPDIFINPSWADFFFQIGRIPQEWQESILDQLETIDTLSKQYQKIEIPFGEEEIIELRQVYGEKGQQ